MTNVYIIIGIAVVVILLILLLATWDQAQVERMKREAREGWLEYDTARTQELYKMDEGAVEKIRDGYLQDEGDPIPEDLRQADLISCGDCRRFIQSKPRPHPDPSYKFLGECREALELAQSVVPFAMHLHEWDVGMVFANALHECPFFEPKATGQESVVKTVTVEKGETYTREPFYVSDDDDGQRDSTSQD